MMRRFIFALFLVSLVVLAGCATKSSDAMKDTSDDAMKKTGDAMVDKAGDTMKKTEDVNFGADVDAVDILSDDLSEDALDAEFTDLTPENIEALDF